MSARIQAWLQKHREAFGSHDKLPSDFHREHLFNSIDIGDTVGIITAHGHIRSGTAVMRSPRYGEPTHFVLNGGGAHGTPIIADARNTIYVSGAGFKGRVLVTKKPTRRQ
jgi:hypothetical protein